MARARRMEPITARFRRPNWVITTSAAVTKSISSDSVRHWRVRKVTPRGFRMCSSMARSAKVQSVITMVPPDTFAGGPGQGRGQARGGGRGRRLGNRLGRGDGRGGGRKRGGFLRRRRAFPGPQEIPEQFPDDDRRARRGGLRRDVEHTAIGGLDILRGFIAFQSEKRLAGFYGVAGFLEPAHKAAFFHRPSQTRHFDLNGHGTSYRRGWGSE